MLLPLLSLCSLLPSVLSTETASSSSSSSSSSRCSATELAGFKNDYEECHAKALGELQLQMSIQQRSDKNDAGSQERAVCSGLRKLLDECSVILGWCYSEADVAAVREKQRHNMQAALEHIFTGFSANRCLSLSEEDLRSPISAPSVNAAASAATASVFNANCLTIVAAFLFYRQM